MTRDSARASFDLVQEPWISVWHRDGRLHELGLADVLKQAHRLRETHHPSPLVVISLYRLLLALVTRIFAPADRKAWSKLWTEDRFDPDAIDAYLGRWQDRFDLLHPEFPFYQSVELRQVQTSASAVSPLARLAHELSSGNNTTLFDHTVEAIPIVMDPAEAARRLVAVQAFAVGGGHSEPFNFSHGPLLGRYVLLVRGETLKDTLLLNTASYPREGLDGEDDVPAWERSEPLEPGRKSGEAPAGRLDLLTWQSRRIYLMTEGSASDTVISGVCIKQNRKLRDGYLDEPMAAYRRNEQRGWLPIAVRPVRDAWRDSHSFFAVTYAADLRGPLTVRWLAELTEEGYLDSDARFPMTVFGLANTRGKLLLWRENTLPLSVQFLHDPACYGDLKIALDISEQIRRHLRAAASEYAKHTITPSRDGESDPKAVQLLIDRLDVEGRYWSALGALSSGLLATLPGSTDHRTARLDAWNRDVVRAARRALSDVLSHHAIDARRLRALARAETLLRGRLAEMNPTLST